MAIPLDARERAELCARFSELGPDAPTLCGDWTTFDLAAHLVVRERNPLSGPGIILGGPFERLTDWAMDREKGRGYDAVVERVRSGPPLVPWRLPVVRNVLNLSEYFVHHEDVRRANGETRRTDRPDLDAAFSQSLKRMAPLLLRKSDVDVELVDGTGTTLYSRGHRPPKVIGPSTEVLLWLYGRGAVADVSFDGDEAAVSALWTADLGI